MWRIWLVARNGKVWELVVINSLIICDQIRMGIYMVEKAFLI